ncbi:MAG: alpha/beta hydrolase [Limnobacter sp.]|nr:alpha/beta hydrolase [Limnobacter sp.]
MKKTIAYLALAGVTGLALANAATYPAVGEKTLQVGGQIEARVHGLTEKSVLAGGISHRIYEGGDAQKPTLVLLHGYSADKDVWPRFAAHLVKDFHIVIPDMAGHGETGFHKDWTYDIPSQAARIVALMDEMGVDKFHVAGNSMGGFITATLAANYPGRVMSATAIDPAGVMPPVASKMDKMIAAGQNPFEVQDRAQFDAFYAMTMAKPPYMPKFVLDGLAKTYQDRREELAVIYQGFHRKDMLDNRLADIKVPFFLIWGKKDELLDVSSVSVWQAGVPGIKVHVFEELGHMPMVEAPKATADVVGGFLKSI